MRLNSKYKIFLKATAFVASCPLKLLRFHKTKWKRQQKRLLRLLSRKKGRKKRVFKDNFNQKIRFKFWNKIKNKYKSNLKLKNTYSQLFDSSIKKNLLKQLFRNSKQKDFNEIFLNILIKPEFKLNILLCRLNFFKTNFQAQQSISAGEILLNGNLVTKNIFVKKGDIISFKNQKKISLIKAGEFIKNRFKVKTFFTFAEYDHYTRTIIILKNYNALTREDFYIMKRHYFNLRKLKDYFN